MTNLHITKMVEVENGIIEVEIGTKILEMELTELATWITNGMEVTFEEEEEITDALKCATIKYITIDSEADGSNEHDVYVHTAIVENGKVKMDVDGEFLKSYKNEKSAIKFANSFNVEVRTI